MNEQVQGILKQLSIYQRIAILGTALGAVALIVALVILVFFAAGYGFGRLFL